MSDDWQGKSFAWADEIAITEANFPDENFRTALLLATAINKAGSFKNFPILATLNASGCTSLTSLDVSGCTKLTAIDISELGNLKSFAYSSNTKVTGSSPKIYAKQLILDGSINMAFTIGSASTFSGTSNKDIYMAITQQWTRTMIA